MTSAHSAKETEKRQLTEDETPAYNDFIEVRTPKTTYRFVAEKSVVKRVGHVTFSIVV